MLNEMAPVSPLNINHFLLLPKIGILAAFKYEKVKTKEINDLKNTISIAGISGTSFTTTFIKAKNKPAINIYPTPFVIS
jgi:hypothetical protein